MGTDSGACGGSVMKHLISVVVQCQITIPVEADSQDAAEHIGVVELQILHGHGRELASLVVAARVVNFGLFFLGEAHV